MTVTTLCCHTVAVGHLDRCLETAGEFQSISTLKHFAIVFSLVNSCSFSELNGDTDFFSSLVRESLFHFAIKKSSPLWFGTPIPCGYRTSLSNSGHGVRVLCVLSCGIIPTGSGESIFVSPRPNHGSVAFAMSISVKGKIDV